MSQIWFNLAHTSYLQILYLPATLTWASNLTINTVKTKIITPLLWGVISPFKNIHVNTWLIHFNEWQNPL